MRKTTFALLLLFSCGLLKAQQKVPSEYGSGLKVSLDASGEKYFRLITWHQFWLDMQNVKTPSGEDQFTATPMLRRSRFLIYAQLSDRFLIMTHFGLNNLTPAGLDPTGQSSQAQLFMHDAYVEYKVMPWLYLGGGLHYWNGISRLNNQSTLNFLPLDNPRHGWPTIGTTDQFARHLGMYAKGQVGKLDYRIAWNSAMVNSIDGNANLQPTPIRASYIGRKALGVEAANIFAGYFNYQFWEKESNKLPYYVGSYHGTKRIFNLGAGFYSHPKGAVTSVETTTDTTLRGENVLIWAADAFLELPLSSGEKGSITAYLSYQASDFGANYQLGGSSQEIFTGSNLYTHAGYLIPGKSVVRWQPYVTANYKTITALDKSGVDFGIGINSLITGHHAKLTLEYRRVPNLATDQATDRVILQAVVFL